MRCKKGIRWLLSEDGRPPHCQDCFHFISAQRFIKLQPVSRSWQGRLPRHGEERWFFHWSPSPQPLINEAFSAHTYMHLSHSLSPSPLWHPLLKENFKSSGCIHVTHQYMHVCVCTCAWHLRVCMLRVDLLPRDCLVLWWDVTWQKLWQLHYLGGVGLSTSARFLSLGPLSHSNIYLLPWHMLSGPLCLSVREPGLLYCTLGSFKAACTLLWPPPPPSPSKPKLFCNVDKGRLVLK